MKPSTGALIWPKRIWSVAALHAACIALDRPAAAEHPNPPAAPVTLNLQGDETAETIRRLVDALSADGRRVEIRIAGKGDASPATSPAASPAPKAPAAPQAPPNDEFGNARVDEFVDSFVDGLAYGNDAIPAITTLPGSWARAWAGNVNGRDGLPAGGRILVSLAVALGLAFAARRLTAAWFRRRMHPASSAFTPRLVASAYGLAQDVATIALAWGVARLARSYWLPAHDLAAIAATTAVNGAAIGACYVAIGRFLLAPGQPERRVMPLPRAERHFRILIAYAIATPLTVTSVLLAHHVSEGPVPVAGLIALTFHMLTLFRLWWFYDMRHDLAGLILSGSAEPGPLRRAIAVTTPWFYIVSTVFLWAVSRAAAMMPNGGRWTEAAAITESAIVILPVLAIGVASYLRCRAERRYAAADGSPLSQATSAAAGAAAVGVIWAAGFFIVARLWAGLLLGVSSGEFMTFSRQTAGVALFAFAGWVALVFLQVFFDGYVPKNRVTGPVDEDAVPEESVPTRLATVLPVLRGVVLSAVIGLTGLVVLSRLGVDIAPLIAGFGILGLAISFGSQALVRDIVSGFFFMLEDAFRVGEYVDTGRLRGTVEKISLRSMQLRHQSGQIHTVPFGQIASLTNSSRDWATLKFNIRLDHSADIEKARKTIKKTGLALLEDPEYGPHFIAPLKMQGVAEIADTAIVVRLKFTAKPAQASMLQREALKRIYRALNEAGVPFASNAVTVRGGEERNAAAAIAAVPPPSPLAPAAS